tara:strand:+ start:264 stop:971 length:708 start_codon:yes stop_codon:yes gene_type:complete
MKDNQNFETYLFLSSKKLIISVNQKKDFKRIYYKEILNNSSTDHIDLDLISYFLENNIFEIEKKIRNFIKNIYLIIDSKKFLTLQLSIKKNNYGNIIDKNNLAHLLSEAKEECKKTINNRKIVHMIIDNYLIDEKYFSSFPAELECKFFSIDLSLICLSNDFIKKIEMILSDYQISIAHILNSQYVENFLNQNEGNDIFEMSTKIVEGYNVNEVLIVPKISNNKGFFERFFNFFN